MATKPSDAKGKGKKKKGADMDDLKKELEMVGGLSWSWFSLCFFK